MRQRSPARARGFTLIELMIVVAVIGVLAMLAYPSYIDQIRRARRAQAESDLMTSVSAMERFHTERMTYVGYALSGAESRSPRTGAAIFYNVSLTAAATATAYTLQAVPADDQVNDGCGTLTINQAGVRGSSSGTAAQCWQGGH